MLCESAKVASNLSDDNERDLRERYEADPDSIVVCSICDLVYEAPRLKSRQTAYCHRCHTAVAYPHKVKVDHTIALAVTSLFLMLGSVHYEFLGVSQSGFSHRASLTDVVEAFSSGWYILLGVFVGAFVIGLPVLRALTLIYVLLPLMFHRPAYPQARRVFTFSQNLGPWLMTEIFIIGVAVALVKIVAMASVEFGASFWIYCVLVLCLGLMNATVYQRAVWDLLREDKRYDHRA